MTFSPEEIKQQVLKKGVQPAQGRPSKYPREENTGKLRKPPQSAKVYTTRKNFKQASAKPQQILTKPPVETPTSSRDGTSLPTFSINLSQIAFSQNAQPPISSRQKQTEPVGDLTKGYPSMFQSIDFAKKQESEKSPRSLYSYQSYQIPTSSQISLPIHQVPLEAIPHSRFAGLKI